MHVVESRLHAGEITGKLAHLERRRIIRRLERGDKALLDGTPTLTIATARRLGSLVKSGFGPPHTQKVEIDAGLDERDDDIRSLATK